MIVPGGAALAGPTNANNPSISIRFQFIVFRNPRL